MGVLIAGGGGVVAAPVFVRLGNIVSVGLADTLTLNLAPITKHMIIRILAISSGVIQTAVRFNLDAALNYDRQQSIDGGADVAATNNRLYISMPAGATATSKEIFLYITNVAAQTKACHYAGVNVSGGISRIEGVGRWNNVADLINSIQLINDGAGDLGIGSEIDAVGWDDA